MRRFLAFVAFIGVACGSAEFRPVVSADDSRLQRAEQAADELERNILGRPQGAVVSASDVGVDVEPIVLFPQFIFGPEGTTASEQPASQRLVKVVEKHEDLHVQALPSGEGTVAIYLIERSWPGQKWGRLMTPALRKIFSVFAADEDADPWLVVVDDVKVTDGPDPVPLTGYRWPRAVVESYAACGIPPTEIDDCTRTFYRKSEIVFLRSTSSQSAGR